MSGNFRPTRSSGRPAHPPFTDFPLAAYVFTAAFDVISAIGGHQHQWAQQLWHAGTFVLIAGLVICLATVGTGFVDLARFPAPSAAASRAIATHVCVMAVVFMIGAGDIAWRLSDSGSVTTAPPGIIALSVAAAATACAGALFGGRLVFRHGLGVAADALAAPPLSADGTTAPVTVRQPPGPPDTLR